MKMRTSASHPLQIAAVVPDVAKCGRIGITFCPGKHDPNAMTGGWDRDLASDLDTIRDWGATAVVTLLEPEEIRCLRVGRIGDEVVRRKMRWFHLPVPDVSIPDEGFECEWAVAGDELLKLLRSGQDVLVHCKGGLGRAGTIAAKILVDLGTPAGRAIEQVRGVRPGAIETRAQEKYVLELVRR